jgi:hypothetical protein
MSTRVMPADVAHFKEFTRQKIERLVRTNNVERLHQDMPENRQTVWDAVFDEARQYFGTNFCEECMVAVRDVFASEWNKAKN